MDSVKWFAKSFSDLKTPAMYKPIPISCGEDAFHVQQLQRVSCFRTPWASGLTVICTKMPLFKKDYQIFSTHDP